MSEKYTILVKAKLDEVNLQKEIQRVNKEVNVKVTEVTRTQTKSVRELENVVTRYKNSLEEMGARYPAAFNTPKVQEAKVAFESLFAGIRSGSVSLDDARTSFDTLNKELVIARSNLRSVNADGEGFTEMITLAAKKVVIWAVATTAIYGSIKAIREGIEYIRELDKELTNIRVVTQITSEEVAALAQNYNELAQSLGVTTLEVAQGSTEWLRQGASIEETQEVLRSTISFL